MEFPPAPGDAAGVSESPALVHAVLLDGQGGGERLGWQAARSWRPEAGPLWLHLDLNEEEARGWIASESGLDEDASQALLAAETRPRATVDDGALILILRGVNHNPGQEPEDMVAIRLWVDAHRIVSAGHRRLRSVGDLLRRLDEGRGPERPGALVAALAHRLVERMRESILAIEEQAEEVEEALLATGDVGDDRRNALAELRRDLIALRRFIAPQCQAMDRLRSADLDWLEEQDRSLLREADDQLRRHLEHLEAVRDQAAVTQQQVESRLTDQLNRRMYLLSIVTGIFLPLSFLTGLLGVNLGGIPGAESEPAFLLFVGLLVGLGLAVGWIFRRSRWL